jgi:glycosyltransferase involved in cell wall biosynthesis
MSAWFKRNIQYSAALLVFLFNRMLGWFFSSRLPPVVHVREFIRHNDYLHSAAWSFISAVRELPNSLRQLFAGRAAKRVQSILMAREIGGCVAVSELELIWNRTWKGARVVAIAGDAEFRQIKLILDGTRAQIVPCKTAAADGIDRADPSDFDLVITASGSGLDPQIETLLKKLRKPDAFLSVGETSKRSSYFESGSNRTQSVERPHSVRRSIEVVLAQGQPLRIVFLNDVGFQYGAGIALKRQVSSFLLNGHDVHVVAWTPGEAPLPPTVTGVSGFQGWRGVHHVGKAQRDRDADDGQLAARVVSTVRALEPDVVVTGNLHGTGFPLDLALGLKTIDALVVSYMHDCFWATGRCAYPGTCQLYQTGCDETCPTADQYPKLAPDRIAPAWRSKAAIFEGEAGIPLVTNSGWTRDLAVRRFGDRARIDCVPLAVDHELFAPIPKAVARRLLGLSPEGLFVVMGAVDILNKWKGGDLFRDIHGRLQNRGDVSLLLFGQSSVLLHSTKSFGLVEDERLMPLILNSADIFVGTATEEAFGQTLLEASACGIPVAAFDRGGIGDIVVNEETGLLVKDLSVSDLYTAIERLLGDPALRELLGNNARKRVESRFTLTKQADAWVEYLKTVSALRRPGRMSIATGGR